MKGLKTDKQLQIKAEISYYISFYESIQEKAEICKFEFALVNFIICLKKRMPKNLFMTIQKAIKSSKKFKINLFTDFV